MKIRINRMLDPDRKIQAIKALRSATRNSLTGEAMGLKDAKHIMDDVQLGTPRETEIVDLTGEFVDTFDFTVLPAEEVTKALVLEFVLDVLAWSDPDTAQRIMQLKSYRSLAEALR